MAELFLIVLNLLNTTAVDFAAAVISQLQAALDFAHGFHSHGFACAFGFCWDNRWN